MLKHHCLIFNISMDPKNRGYGVYKIAHHLRENNWDAEVIDFTTYWRLEQLKELVKSRVTSATKFIGFGHLFIYWTDTLEEFCAWLKLTYPNLIFIAGSQSFPTHNTKYMDYHILGNGENALMALLSYLFSNGPPVIETRFPWAPDRNIIVANNLNSPYAAGYTRDLATQYEDRDFIEPTEWLSMEFSRGCKFSCKFCDFPYLKAKGNYTVAQDIFLQQMNDNYNRFGVKNYIAADSTFNDTPDKIKLYADAVETLNFDPFFTGFIRADLLISRPQDKEDLLRMNFLGHHYGIETLNHETGKAIGKGMHPDKIKEGVLDIHKYFKTHGRKLYAATMTLIAGLPYESVESVIATMKWTTTLPLEIVAHMSPLYIPRRTAMPSDLTLNWKNYGYIEREWTDDVVADVDHSKEIIFWENEHTNFIKARELARNLSRDKVGYTDSWSLASISLDGMEVEERLSCDINYVDTEKAISTADNFLKRYIDRKLSL